MTVKQQDAVYNAIKSIYRDNNKHFEDGNIVELTSDEKKTVIHMISKGLQSGEIEMSNKAKLKNNTEKKIHNYASSLVNDRLRKDKKLNGNKKYETDKKGSRIGSDDFIIKELRAYKKKYCFNDDQKQEAEDAIQRRLKQITNIKMKLVNMYVEK
jgi:hypothetical protein